MKNMINIKKDIKIMRSAEKRAAYLSSVIAIALLIMGLLMIIDGEYFFGLLILIGGISHIFIFKSSFSKKTEIHIIDEGVSVGDKYIKWEEISKIYIKAEKETINFIPTSETKHISLVSDSAKKIDLVFSVFGRMSKKTVNAYNSIYQAIIESAFDRQWKSFVNSLKRGELIDFNLLGIQADGIYFKKYNHGKQLVQIDKILDYYFSAGTLYISFIDENETDKKCRIGELASIPNIHIIQCFLDEVKKSNKKTEK